MTHRVRTATEVPSATINNRLFVLICLPLIAMVLMVWSGTAAAQVARVLDTKGTALVERSGQVPRLLGAGEQLSERDVIKVARDSWAILEFNDQTRITLRPNTVFRLDNYRDHAPEAMLVGLVKGGLRVVTGLFGKRNPSGVKFQTATATIGIRGTEFDARLCEADCAEEERAQPAPRPLILPVARVVEMNGVVGAGRAGEAVRLLVPGALLSEGDAVAVGPGASALLVFRDGARVALAENSRFAINRFRYDEKQPPEGSAFLTLYAGIALVSTGQLAKISPDAFLFRTAVGVIRPFGTTFNGGGCIGNFCASGSVTVNSDGASASGSASAGDTSASGSAAADSGGVKASGEATKPGGGGDSVTLKVGPDPNRAAVDTRKVPVGPGWASTPFPNLPDAATVNEVIGGVQQVVNEVAGNVREGLARTVSEIRTEAREDLRDARRTVRSENREARENLRDGISDAQAVVSDVASEVSDAAAQTRREAREDLRNVRRTVRSERREAREDLRDPGSDERTTASSGVDRALDAAARQSAGAFNADITPEDVIRALVFGGPGAAFSLVSGEISERMPESEKLRIVGEIVVAFYMGGPQAGLQVILRELGREYAEGNNRRFALEVLNALWLGGPRAALEVIRTGFADEKTSTAAQSDPLGSVVVTEGEVEVVGRGRVRKGEMLANAGGPVRMANLPDMPVVKVDPDLFRETSKPVEEGLYVWVRDGAVQLAKDDKSIDVPAGNAAVATKDKITLLDVVPNFLRFDPTPRPAPSGGGLVIDNFRSKDGAILNMCTIR
ncbi:MAG: FecR domain-containing protein [Sulfuritalea sp.]|nr:FecR domain-containing protein [Sulfuritalea sp.]